jgi:hypothetical protein
MESKLAYGNLNHPRKTSGVNEVSPLSHLPMWDMVWDHPMDFMHIVEGGMKSHIVPLMKGERRPKMVQPLRGDPKNHTKEMLAKHKRDKSQRRKDLSDVHAWEMNNMQTNFMDERIAELGGESKWLRSNLALFRRTGSIIAHDWVKFVEDCERYVFHGMFTDVYKEEAVREIMAALRACLHASCDADRYEDLTDCPCVALSHKIRRALCIFEREFPRTELAIVFHLIVHIPAAIHRWNSLRNFWAFFSERSDTRIHIVQP